MRDACHLSRMRETIHIRVPEKLVDAVASAAARRFQSLSEYTRQALLDQQRRDGLDPARAALGEAPAFPPEPHGLGLPMQQQSGSSGNRIDGNTVVSFTDPASAIAALALDDLHGDSAADQLGGCTNLFLRPGAALARPRPDGSP